MDYNEYEKGMDDCWDKYMEMLTQEIDTRDLPNAGEVFEFVFERAYQLGMASQRLQVAAMAMQGLLSNEHGFQFNNKDVAKSPENVASAAVLYADALLTELNRKNL